MSEDTAKVMAVVYVIALALGFLSAFIENYCGVIFSLGLLGHIHLVSWETGKKKDEAQE